MPLVRAASLLLAILALGASAAPVASIGGADPLLQGQFAQPRCWSSAASAAQWARAGARTMAQGEPWRAQPATAGPRWARAGAHCVADRASGLAWATGAVQDDVALADTERVAAQAREQALCGHADWRLPTRTELAALIDYSAPSADTLPGLGPAHRIYWTATPRERDNRATGHRFTVTLASGEVRIEPPSVKRAVLLVRDSACQALGRGFTW